MSDEQIPIGTTFFFQQRFEGYCPCEKCGKPVEIWSETESWDIDSHGNHLHAAYGLPSGGCCGDMYGAYSVSELAQIFGTLIKRERENE